MENLSTGERVEIPRVLHSSGENPLITIRPSKKWEALRLGDLWHYRELLYFLAWRDIKVRYKQMVLGATWAIIQPLLMMIIFTLFFGKLAGMPSDGIPYPIFTYAGLLPWMFFSNGVTGSSNSLVGNANLISKVYFPRMIIPGAAIAVGLIDFLIAFIILAGMMVYYRVSITWSILLFPLLVVMTVLFALGIGMWLSALNVKYRDIRYVMPFLMQFWMFATPVIYPSSLLPQRWRWVLALNPLTAIIEGYRAALFGRQFDWAGLSISAVIILALLFYAMYSFRRMEKSFADII